MSDSSWGEDRMDSDIAIGVALSSRTAERSIFRKYRHMEGLLGEDLDKAGAVVAHKQAGLRSQSCMEV